MEKKSCSNCKWYSKDDAYTAEKEELHTTISGCCEIDVYLRYGKDLEDFYCSKYKRRDKNEIRIG